MKKSILRTIVFGLLAVAVALAPTQALAQEKKQTPAAEKKKGTPPIHGKVAAVDKTAKTITVGQTVIQITSETKITKTGKPATLDDAVVGEEVMAHGKKGDDGKYVAKTVRFGAKAEGEDKGEKKKGKKNKKEN